MASLLRSLVAALLVNAWANSVNAAIPALEQIQAQKRGNFQFLLDQWNARPSPKLASELSRIALDRSLAERSRYIALMGAAGAAQISDSHLHSLLKTLKSDSSWVMRSAVLEVLENLPADRLSLMASPQAREMRSISLGLLRDKALVVRSQSVETTLRLKPPGAAQALVDAALDPINHPGGRALWVPQKALRALSILAQEGGVEPSARKQLAQRLQPLTERRKDSELAGLARATLSSFEASRPRESASRSALSRPAPGGS